MHIYTRYKLTSFVLAFSVYLTRHCLQDPEHLVGIWFSPLIFKLVQGMWYKKDDDDGIKFVRFFHPTIKLPTIALCFTVVSNLRIISSVASSELTSTL